MLLLVALTAFTVRTNAQCKDWLRVGTEVTPAWEPIRVAVDGTGTPYVISQSATTHRAWVKKYNGSDWVAVGAADLSVGYAGWYDIKIGNSDTPYIAFTDMGDDAKATVMKFNGSSWVTVGSGAVSSSSAMGISLAIDGAGTPYLAFQHGATDRPTVMKFNGSSWVLVGSAMFIADHVEELSLAIDNTSGTPYVAFRNIGTGYGSVMKYNGSSWVYVGASNIAGSAVVKANVAVSSTGVPYLCYGLNESPYGVYVKTFDGTSWNALGGTVFTGHSDGDYIVLGPGDVPYAACFMADDYSGRSVVKKFDGTSWSQIGSVNLNYYATSFSFAVSPAGQPYTSMADGYIGGSTVFKYEAISATITGSSTMCLGGTTTLSHPQEGGNWSSVSNSILTIGSTTGIVEGVGRGVSTLSYTIGQCSAIKTVTVNPNTGAISGAHSVNVGSSVTLSNIATGGTWSVSNGNASINSSGVLTGITAGTTTVSYTATGSCGTASVQLVVDVLPASGLACRDWVDAGSPVVGSLPSGFLYTYKIKMAPDGTAYALYSTNGDGSSICVKRFNGSEWESVGGSMLPYDQYATSAVADMTIDNSGNVYVVADDYEASYVYRYNGYYWEVLPVLPSMNDEIPKIATDASGAVYVAYVEWITHKLTVVKYNGTGWDVVGAPAFSAGTIWEDIKFCIGGTTPYVLYKNYDNSSKVDVMKFNGSSWEYAGGPGISWASPYYTDLAVASDGTAYVGYDAVVKKFNGTSWETLAAFQYDSYLTNLMLDESDVLYAGVLNGYTGVGSVMKYSEGAWSNLGSPAITTSWATAAMTMGHGDGYVLYAPSGTSDALAALKYGVKAGGLTAITGPATVCTGGAITLSESVTVGSWSSSAAEVVTVGSANGIVTGISGGTATISYSIGTSCLETHTVSNASTAGLITGPLNVQVGNTASFSNAVTGGTWSVSNSNASMSASGVLTGLSAGTVTVSYANSTCGSIVTTAVVTVYTAAGSCSAWETVGTTGYSVWSAYDFSSAIDAGGRPYVIYSEASSDLGPFVKRYDGASWVQLGTGPLNPSATTHSNVIAIDTAGTPYVAYADNYEAIVHVKKFNGASWSSVGTIYTSSYNVDMAFDANGTLYVALVDLYNGYRPTVMRYNGSTWETLGDIPGTSSWDARMKLAFHGTTPYVVATDADHSLCPTVWKFNGTNWEVVGTPGFIGGTSGASDPDIAINSAGTPYVICADNSNGGKATVMKFNGSSWVAVGSALSAGTAQDISIVIDGDDNVLVTYFEEVATPVMAVKKYDGSAWSNVGPASVTEVGRWAALAVDPAGVPYLTFADIAHAESRAATIRYFASSSASISGSAAICSGGTSTLTSSSTGGTWSSSNAAVAAVDSSSGVVSGISNGTAVISYTVGSCSASVIVTVSAGGSAGAITGTLSVCPSATTTLGNATASGTWTSSNPSYATVDSYTGVVTGVTAGNAVITYTVISGCGTSTSTAIVTINASPSAGTITGTAVVCESATTTLNNSTAGGSWSSSNASVATIGSSSGVVSGVIAGNATISYTVTTGCGTASATKIVTVNAAPSAGTITGAATVCTGNTTTLGNATPGGIWSSNSTAIATVGSATGVVSGVAVGNATITYSFTSGCGTATTTAVVTVNGTPSAATITGTATVCTSNTTTFSNATSGGAWSSSNTSIAAVGSTTGIVSGVAAGNATITYTVSNGCGGSTATKVVTVNAATSAGTITGAGSICTGATVTLNNTTTGGTWSSSNASIATVGSLTGVVTGAGSGNATITYTVSGACGTAIATKVVTVGATASITGSLSLCTGMTSTLSGGASGGTWSSSNTAVAAIGASSGVLVAVATGTANITYNLGSGCMATAVASISQPAIIGGTSNACVGQTAVLTDATTGGAWSSGNTSLATVDAGTGIVIGVAAGTTTISYAVSAGCYRTIAFTVKALPPAIAGPITVCEGATVYVTPPSSNGQSWTSSNTSVATIGSSSNILTGVSAGTTTLTYTTITGCYVTTVVTVNAAPSAITGTTVLCAGSTSSLTSATTGGAWSSSNASVATIGSVTGVLTAVNAGTATITYNAGACSRTIVATVSPIAAITGTPSMCVGLSATLSNAASGGTWSSSNTGVAIVGTSGIVTGVAAGNATVTYALATGCSRTITATVAATPGAITGTLSVCPAATTALGNAATGGTWHSTISSIASINTSTGVLTGVGAGTTNVTYTLGSGCTTISVATVNPQPAVIAGTTNACVAQTATLTDATSGGTWTSSNTAIATVDPSTGIVTGVSAATATMTYTIGTGCFRTSAFTVKALPPAVASPVAACVGTTTSIAPPSTNGKSWTSSNTAVATMGSSSGIMTGVSTGTTTLTYTTIPGCFVTTVATVYALPSAGTITGSTSVIPGSTITLNDAAGGGVWSSGNTARATIGSATGIVTGVAGGTASISYSVSNPGCTVRATQMVSVLTSRPGGEGQSADGNGQLAVRSMQLYPNPTAGAFTVVVDEAGTFSIFSLDGREVSRYNIVAGVNQLSQSKELASGIYMCRYTSESGNTTMVRLVYER
jgi:uncharacterized protein YjdB